MEIKRTEKALQVTKAEEDQRSEVSKLKPIGQNQIPDSFETGSSRSSGNESKGSAAAEPEKKAGQRTGGILIKQMTAARLGEAGIKSAGSRQLKEIGVRQDLSPGDQDAADTIKPKLKKEILKDNVGTPGFTTSEGPRISQGAFTGNARSNRDNLHNQEMQNFLKDSGFNIPSSGGGTTSGSGHSTGGGGGGVTNGSGGGGIGSGAPDLSSIAGGPTGPSVPLASENAMSNAVGRSKEAFDRLVAQVTGGLGSPQGDASANYHKGMISEGVESVRDNGDGTTTHITDSVLGNPAEGNFMVHHHETTEIGGVRVEIDDGMGINGGDHDVRHTATSTLQDGSYHFSQTGTATDRNGNTTTWSTQETGSKNGSWSDTTTAVVRDRNGHVISSTTEENNYVRSKDANGDEVTTLTDKTETKDKNGKTTSSKTETTTTRRHKNADGSTTVTTTKPDGTEETHEEPASGKDTSQEEHQRIQGERLHRLMRNKTGIDSLVIPKQPRIQGDKDPTPEESELSDAAPSIYARLGEYGMVGQPIEQNEGGNGGGYVNPNGPAGGATVDYQDRSGYRGAQRTNDPGDVDTTLSSKLKPKADDDKDNDD